MQGQFLKHLRSLQLDGLYDSVQEYIPVNRKTLSMALAIIVTLTTGLAAVIPAVTSASRLFRVGRAMSFPSAPMRAQRDQW